MAGLAQLTGRLTIGCGCQLIVMILLLQSQPGWTKVKIPIGAIFSKAPGWQDVFDAMNLGTMTIEKECSEE